MNVCKGYLLIWACTAALMSCDSNDRPPIPELELEVLKTISTDDLIPNSYVINSKINQLGDTLFYWDDSRFQLVLVDKAFNWIGNLLGQKGVGPQELSFYAGHSLIDDKFFLFGNQSVVYDANTLEFLGKYQLPLMDIDWIIKFQGKYLIGGLFYEENHYSVYSIDFDLEKGFYNQQQLFNIDFPERLDELSKKTNASVLGNYLFILKPDLGELVKVNADFKVISDKALPYSYSQEENIIDHGDELDINIYESWDFAVKDGKLYFLRSLDLANLHLPKEMVHRKTVHILNSEGQMLSTMHLDEKALFISFIDNTLLTVDHYDEKYIQYQILD